VMLDHIGRELDGNRCKTCHMSQLRTGDQASLLLRAQKLIEEIKELQKAEKPAATPEGVTNLASIRAKRGIDRSPDAEDSGSAKLGTKAGTRRSGPGRRQSGQ